MNYTAPLLICIATAWLGWNAAGAGKLRDTCRASHGDVSCNPGPASGRRKLAGDGGKTPGVAHDRIRGWENGGNPNVAQTDCRSGESRSHDMAGETATFTGTPELHLARTCELEAGGFPRDCAAIYWVAVRRATLPAFQGHDWVHAMLEYSRLYKRRNARARGIARLPFGPLPDATRWERLMRLSERIVAGEVPDPCWGRAWHWRGPMDPHRANLRPVWCGRTRNQFLAFRRVER